MDCSKKFDKIDKIFISFTFIIVTLICLFNTYSNASEILKASYKNNSAVINNVIIERSDNTIYYYNLKKGHTYKITNNYNYNYSIYMGNSLEYGTKVSRPFYQGNLPYGESSDFYADSDYLLGFFSSNDLTRYLVIEDITKPGLPYVISDLVGTFGFGFFDDVLVNVIPFVFVVVIFSLGFWFIIHNIFEHSKGRDF